MSIVQLEKDKYENAWNLESYRNFSPGLYFSDLFIKIAKPQEGDSLVDYGCGSGKALKKFRDMGLDVMGVDLADNALDDDAKDIKFVQSNLWTPLQGWPKDFGYCTDVMEHLPPEYTMLAVHNMTRKVDKMFFSISLVDDEFGKVLGSPLHLTVRPFQWWRDRLMDFGKLIEARDLIHNGIFYLEC